MRVPPSVEAIISCAEAIFTVGLAFLIQLAFWSHIGPFAFFMFYPAVFLSAWFGGVVAGLSATMLSVVTAKYFFIPPAHTLAIHSWGDVVKIAGFGLMGVAYSFVTARFRSYREKERTEKLVREKEKFVKIVRTVTDAADSAPSAKFHQLVKFCLQELCALTRWPLGHAYFISRDSAGKLVSSGIWCSEDPSRFRAFREATEATAFFPGIGLPGRILESGKAAWIRDVAQDANFLRAKVALNVGIRSAFGFPIRIDGTVIGVLEFFSPAASEPDQSLLEVMEHIGSQLGQVYRHQETEEVLRVTEGRYRLTLDSAYDAFVAIDEKGVITDWNPQAETTFGWSKREVLGRPIRETIIPSKFRKAHSTGLSRFLATGEGPILNRRIELAALHRDGREFPVELTVTPVRVGQTCTFSAFIHDITERKRDLALILEREEALRKTKDELEIKVQERTRELQETVEALAASNADLEQFAFIASHDLQEPLRMVTIYLEFIEKRAKEKLDTEDRQFVRFAVDGALRMKALIEDLLAYARVGRGRENATLVDFNQVVALVESNLKAAIDESGARITVGELPALMADPVQMVQLFQNLVANAIKYRGEAPPSIHLAAEEKERDCLFSIRDNGIGISPEYAERIFVVFQRLHSDRQKYPGTGIGLAICKKIVERHRGRIWVQSQLGQGSTFFFTIPRAITASPSRTE